jgi:hypothetical protein
MEKRLSTDGVAKARPSAAVTEQPTSATSELNPLW